MRLYRSKLTSRLHFNIDSVGDIQIHSPVSKQELAGALVTAAHPMPARSTARRSCPQSVNVGCREDMLKRELADITRRGQAAEARHEELASAMPEATRPLLRQIEAMQAAAAAPLTGLGCRGALPPRPPQRCGGAGRRFRCGHLDSTV